MQDALKLWNMSNTTINMFTLYKEVNLLEKYMQVCWLEFKETFIHRDENVYFLKASAINIYLYELD